MRSIELGLAEILSSNSDYSVTQVDIALSQILCLGKVGKNFAGNKQCLYIMGRTRENDFPSSRLLHQLCW